MNVRPREMQDKILEALKTMGPMKSMEVSTLTDIGYKSCSAALSVMAKHGEVVHLHEQKKWAVSGFGVVKSIHKEEEPTKCITLEGLQIVTIRALVPGLGGRSIPDLMSALNYIKDTRLSHTIKWEHATADKVKFNPQLKE